MKNLTIAVLLFLLLPAFASAEEVVYDGYYWITMGHIAKGYFLEGFNVGVEEASNNKDYKGLYKRNYMKIVDAMDLFYRGIENRGIHVPVAIYIVLQKIQGRSIETIKKLTKRALKYPTRIPRTK